MVTGKINLGAGTKKKEGYTSIDSNPECKPDILCDLNWKLPYLENVEAFWLDNSLEHFKNPQSILEHCYLYLLPEGVIEIICPNVQWFPLLILGWFIDIHRFWNWWMTLPFKKGRGIHYTLWTPYTLRLALETIGFKVVKTKGWYLGKQFYIKAIK